MENKILEEFKASFDYLKKKIDAHISNGGSIYDPKRKSPHYDYMQKLIKKIRASYSPEFSRVDAYRLCGYNFDPEYNDYLTLLDTLAEHADENNFVDSIKKIDGAKSPKTLLKKLSDQIDASPSDYLILMTDYRYENAIIRTDYVKQLIKEIREVYPPGSDTTGIKRDHPEIYYKITQLCKYGHDYGITNMQSAARFLKIENERFSSNDIFSHLRKKDIIKEALRYCPDGCIDELLKLSETTYFNIAKCAASEGKRISVWCKENGLTYNMGQNNSSLSRTKVDAKKRERELLTIRDRITQSQTRTFKDPVEEYYYRKNIARQVMLKADQDFLA